MRRDPVPTPALALVCLLACSPGPAADRTATGAVVVVADTARADRLSVYGHERPTAPALEALAREGVVFEQAISAAPWTLPSLVALLSGHLGGRDYDPAAERLLASLVDAFRGAGVRTSAITEGGFFSRHFGLDLGFDAFEEEEAAVRLAPDDEPPPDGPATGSVSRTFARARAWLSDHREERFLLVVHTYEPHAPYLRQAFTAGLQPGNVGRVFVASRSLPLLASGALRFGEEDLRYLRALYDGGLLATDRELGALVEHLEELGIADRTVVVYTSDHGEALGEHHPSRAGSHGHALHDELVRVPLVIHDPTRRYRVARVATQVRTVDVLPTVAELLEVPLPQPLDGRSLVPLMRGEETADRIAWGGSVRVGPPRSFVRTGDLKYIEVRDGDGSGLDPPPPPVQLYDLREDPEERRNLAAERPELTAELSALLARLSEGELGTLAPDPEGWPAGLRERLRSLGYVD